LHSRQTRFFRFLEAYRNSPGLTVPIFIEGSGNHRRMK
jgi:hypothetical protein